MTKLFISDLHLDEQRPEITQLFLNFLKTEAIKAEELYILGDFFEAWIGDDDLSPFTLSIIQGLRELTQKGLPVYLMHGNRDFLIGKQFEKMTGCKLLRPDENVIDLYGVPALLMHGDTLCTLDVKYLKARKILRSWIYRRIILLHTLKKRRKIAANMRAKSRKHLSTTADYVTDVTQDEVERIMQKNQVQLLIHGHTHREAVHKFKMGPHDATRIVLGAWHERGSVLVCKPNGERMLLSLDA